MSSNSAPLSGSEILDLYFLENRARLLELASFLDRLDRAPGASLREDYRCRALFAALTRLGASEGDRARALQLIFSDPTREPIESAVGLKGASGAYREGQ